MVKPLEEYSQTTTDSADARLTEVNTNGRREKRSGVSAGPQQEEPVLVILTSRFPSLHLLIRSAEAG
jgi:hypothetical protein